MQTGIAIALAWPETWCKEAGSWYDRFMKIIGISKNGYYRVGHAAVVLVDTNSGRCHYFDFGRYHCPKGYGRIRDAETDHDLKIKTQARFSQGGLSNYRELLEEISMNDACHGAGVLHASYTSVDFKKAIHTAKSLQENSPLPYGPFIPMGTNCSRFVRQIIISASSINVDNVSLFIPLTISPMPLSNVKSLKNYQIIGK